MTPRTFDELAHGTASNGCIHLRNPEFANVDGPAPMFAFGSGLVLHLSVLDSVVYGGQALRMAPTGCILEFTYTGGQYPHSSLVMARSSTQET